MIVKCDEAYGRLGLCVLIALCLECCQFMLEVCQLVLDVLRY